MRRLIEPSHLDLCCLQNPFIIACGSERVKFLYNIHEEPCSLRGCKHPLVLAFVILNMYSGCSVIVLYERICARIVKVVVNSYQ